MKVIGPDDKLEAQRCGWCEGEGAVRDRDGKLGEDCPRCKGARFLVSAVPPCPR